MLKLLRTLFVQASRTLVRNQFAKLLKSTFSRTSLCSLAAVSIGWVAGCGSPLQGQERSNYPPIGSAQARTDLETQEPALWWTEVVSSPTRDGSTAVPITLEMLLLQAIDCSNQIQVYSDLPLIRETAVCEADAAFDPAAFLDSRWDDTSDPVGNSLTTGGATRYENHQWAGGTGLRKRTRSGGKLEAAQRFGFQDTNSIYFVPDQQGTARLSLNFTQPLLRGRGTKYNESLTVLAKLDTAMAEDEFSRQLQAHLIEISRIYWTLYLERCGNAQKRRSLQRAEDVLVKLQARKGIDAILSQLQRAEAEVATRRSDLIRSEMAVKNSEARIRALVNSPLLGTDESTELLPMDKPSEIPVIFSMEESMATALQTRPEITQALKQIQSGAIRLDMSKNELLPTLNLITDVYMSQLEGEGRIGDAFTSQFHNGTPGYSIGLQYEVPLGNRAARAREERRTIELRQLQNQYETTVRTLNLEVEVAVREVETAFTEMQAQQRALMANAAQLEYLEKRWQLLPGDEGNGSLILDNLLTAQERLTKSEWACTQAAVTYNVAMVNHRRATGELLQKENISWGDYKDECDDLKRRVLFKESPSHEQSLTSDDGAADSLDDVEIGAMSMIPEEVPESHSTPFARLGRPVPITKLVKSNFESDEQTIEEDHESLPEQQSSESEPVSESTKTPEATAEKRASRFWPLKVRRPRMPWHVKPVSTGVSVD